MRQIKVQSEEDYRDTILWLMDRGLEPVVYKRGCNLFRFHLTRVGNWWYDADSKLKACESAVNYWIDAGMPAISIEE